MLYIGAFFIIELFSDKTVYAIVTLLLYTPTPTPILLS
jgi:hypothetical protein